MFFLPNSFLKYNTGAQGFMQSDKQTKSILMKRFTIIYLLSIAFALNLLGQDNNDFPSLSLSASYYSESFWMQDAYSEEEVNNSFFNNSGLNMEGQYSLLVHRAKAKENRKGSGFEMMNLGLNAYFYSVENQSFNTIVSADLSLEKEFFFGLQLFGKLGFGMLNTRMAGTVYTVEANGSVSETSNLSYREMILPSSLGIGWNFEKLLKLPISLRIRTMHFSRSFDQFSIYKAGLLLGMEYRFNVVSVSPIKEF
jgi:hypothetical protein